MVWIDPGSIIQWCWNLAPGDLRKTFSISHKYREKPREPTDTSPVSRWRYGPHISGEPQGRSFAFGPCGSVTSGADGVPVHSLHRIAEPIKARTTWDVKPDRTAGIHSAPILLHCRSILKKFKSTFLNSRKPLRNFIRGLHQQTLLFFSVKHNLQMFSPIFLSISCPQASTKASGKHTPE